MARPRKNEKARPSKLSEETKKSILGILFLALALILALAGFHKAGPAGEFLFGLLEGLLGVGYFLVPLTFFIVGFLFLLSREQKFFSIVFFGMLFFILSGLGLIDMLSPESGGFLGKIAGAVEIPFGRAAGIIIALALLLTSLLITLNASIHLRWPESLSWKRKEKFEELSDENLGIGADEEEDVENAEAAPEEVESRPAKAGREEELKVTNGDEFVPSKSKSVKVRNYVPPPLSLLKSFSEKPSPGDLRANANIIKRTLESFGIPVEMGEINIGPKVTRYTLKPAEGVKLTKILALGQDLALALAAHPIRIEAPIPGKSLVGIEVPNKQASIVRLGSMLAYPDFTNNGPLVFPLGRDVSGEAIFANIEKLPHLLVAGATGSGKSILIHSLIIPLLYKNSPEMLKLILIDPKRVELTTYEGIPHLVSPVITEGKKTIAVFRWALSEMDRRYEILMRAGARDLKSYNKNRKEDQLPYIVIVIDELADLMASFGREIEGYIVRLAQMARATGIHLVLATQRPSVEVVTGLIKANITARVALQVASQIDSRTILDMAGAEKLLGGGDALFISAEYSKPKRVQGSYISEEEIKDVVGFIKEHNEMLGPSELDAESKALDKAVEGGAPAGADPFAKFMNDTDEDEMLPQAIETVKAAGKASASLLQRRLQVGYARAARLLDIMENKGLIGPGEGAKPRDVYLDGVAAGSDGANPLDQDEKEDVE